MTARDIIRNLEEYPPDTPVWLEVDAGIALVGGVERERGTSELVIYPKGRDS